MKTQGTKHELLLHQEVLRNTMSNCSWHCNTNFKLYKGTMTLMLLLKKTKDIGTKRVKLYQKFFLFPHPELLLKKIHQDAWFLCLAPGLYSTLGMGPIFFMVTSIYSILQNWLSLLHLHISSIPSVEEIYEEHIAEILIHSKVMSVFVLFYFRTSINLGAR